MRVERRTRIGLRAVALLYLAALLAVPVGLVVYRTFEHGFGQFWDSITTPAAIHAFWLTLEIALIAVPLNTIFGVITALAVVRGRIRGKLRRQACESGISPQARQAPHASRTAEASLPSVAGLRAGEEGGSPCGTQGR